MEKIILDTDAARGLLLLFKGAVIDFSSLDSTSEHSMHTQTKSRPKKTPSAAYSDMQR